MKTTNFTASDYELVAGAVFDHYDKSADKDAFAACTVRLAGHDFMDFRRSGNTTTGGSDGCVNFADKDNAGLEQCLRSSNLNEVYGLFCDKLSLADFIVLSAEALMLKTSTKFDSSSPFATDSFGARLRDRFRFGRQTNKDCSATDLLPDPEEGCNDLSKIFVHHIFWSRRMNAVKQGHQWKMIAAISGAHTLGSAKQDQSGYEGVWTESPGKFNNEYYINMLAKGRDLVFASSLFLEPTPARLSGAASGPLNRLGS